MKDSLRDKIVSKLDDLSDERGRQILDYLEFLESKYNRNRRAPSTFQKIQENIEDSLGGGRIADAASKGTSQVVEAAGRVMDTLAAAGKAVADELTSAAETESAEEEVVEQTEEDQEAAGDKTDA